MHLHSFLLSLAKVVLLGATIPAFGAEFYVATNGSDATGDGTRANPWASITHALDRASSDDVVSVQPGTYSGRVRLRGNFDPPVRVRSEVPYQARLRNGDRVVTAYEDARGTRGIVLEGFDIAHTGPGAGALVIHIDGGGDGSVSHITVRNNIVHDSFNNDLLKVNNFSTNVTIERNMFYNQEGSDEHIDANGVRDVVIQDNVFFNDFSGSGRTNPNNTSSYVVIKDSNGSADGLVGARDVTLRRNVFLNWEGSTGHNFVLVGEDGQPFHEAFDITVENSLMLGNSANTMRSPLSVKGGRDVVFRNNTIVGDLPALEYGLRLVAEGSNPDLMNIRFYNNVWSDQTGTMNRFSRAAPDDVESFVLDHNLYWNAGNPIPADSGQAVNYTDDGNRVVADPRLPNPKDVIPPRWDPISGNFKDGSSTICAVFEKLVRTYGIYASGSPLVGAGLTAEAPRDDILGVRRTGTADIGAVQGSARMASDTDGDSVSDYCDAAPGSAPGAIMPAINSILLGE